MNIISHIRESGKTVSEVCQEAGITRAAFYKAIKPEGNPQLETLLAISRATGLSPSQIKPRLADGGIVSQVGDTRPGGAA